MARLIYLTSLKYPATVAHPLQTYKMAEQFSNLLSDNFNFVISKNYSENFGRINVTETECEKYKKFHFITPFYFFWLARYFYKNKDSETVFYLKDQKLAVLLVVMRKTFGLKFKLAFEYHILYKKHTDRLICKNADFIIPITYGLKEELASRYKADPAKLFVAADGVDMHEFNIHDDKNRYRKELNLPLNKKLAGYVGTVQTQGQEKGITEIIESARIIDSDNLIIYIIGFKGGQYAYYRSLVDSLGLENKIKLIKYQPRPLIPKYLKAFDILLMPFPDKTHFARFMSPLKLFEYMASKRPIIASDLPSIREVVSEKECFFVKPGDAMSLAAAIKTFSGNPIAAANVANSAFNKVQNYTWTKRAQNILDFIDL